MDRNQILPGIPAYITRKELVALIEGVGFEVNDLLSLEFHRDGVVAEVFAGKPGERPGFRYLVDGENVATHRVTIAVIDQKDPE